MTTNTESTMRAKLVASLSPSHLEIENESHLHHGHASSPETGNSHFRIKIVSKDFEGMTRVDRQRLVYRTLSKELAGPVHALALSTRTPSEETRLAEAT